MPEIVQLTMTALCAVTQDVTLGTNLALLQFMWMLVSGALLPSRGAVFPALQAVGLVPAAVRRAWAALHSGDWHIADLLTAWRQYVLEDQQWQASRYAAIYDPRYRTPWLLASPVKLTGAAWRGLYQDRWPIEQIPLAGKQMVGGARQFVFADEARYGSTAPHVSAA